MLSKKFTYAIVAHLNLSLATRVHLVEARLRYFYGLVAVDGEQKHRIGMSAHFYENEMPSRRHSFNNGSSNERCVLQGVSGRGPCSQVRNKKNFGAVKHAYTITRIMQ